MDNYLSQLNQQQRDAVEYCDGPQLVIAGAGSGKTRVLTYKIVHLLANGYEPWRILALTFTNKAAREMRERIIALTGEKTAQRLWMGTFHSIFAKILRRNSERVGFKSSFTIYDARDSLSLIKAIIKEYGLDDKVYKPALIQSIISKSKNALVFPDRYEADNYKDDLASKRPEISNIFRTYVARCRVAGAMDFDDILYYTNVLLRDNEDVRNYYQEFFQYVLVDEYQDTNFAQHLIVQQLCKRHNRLCVVGDDAQSIYSFRGANIRNILSLQRSFPGIQTFKLEQNYRSTQNILDAANTLIEKNRNQIQKHIFSDNDRGEPVEVVRSYSDIEEAYKVAANILYRHNYLHQSFDNFAILYRTNAQSRVLEQALGSGGLHSSHGNKRRSIPYRIYGGTSFYQRKEIKDALAYLRLTVNPDDDEALRRIINYPARGIGDTTLGRLNSAATAANVSIWTVLNDPDKYGVEINSGTKNKLNAFRDLIAEFIRMNVAGTDASEMVSTIIERSRLIAVLAGDSAPESVSKVENLNELLSGARQFVDDQRETGYEDSIFLSDYLTDISLATDLDDPEKENDGNCVTLMTVHAAKGLEFTNVYVVGVEEDLFPSAMAKDSEDEIEEERRLMYVAITRAKRYCMISYAESRYRNGQTVFSRPSRFISDIDPQFLSVNLGKRGVGLSSERPSVVSSSPFSPSGKFAPMKPTTTPRPTFTPTPSPTPSRVYSGPQSAFPTHTVNEIKKGDRIEHSRFGKGTIIDVDANAPEASIIVDFDNLDTKKLLLKYAKFNIL